MSYTRIIVEKKNSIGYIIINKPQVLNALDKTVLKELLAAVDDLETELQAFIDAIKGNAKNAGVSGTEALTVLKVTDFILGLLAAGTIE